jgi:hypothetical protein
MSDMGLMVPGMNESPSRYDVTVTVARAGPAEFAMAAKLAAASRSASVVTAHTAEQIISVVTVQAADRPSAVTVALAVVAEALRCPAGPSVPGSGEVSRRGR